MQKIMPISKFIFGLICLSVLLKAPLVDANTYEIAKAYYDAGNYPAAYEEFLKLADSDNADALIQTKLGIMHSYGEGTKVDFKKAFEWFKKAAIQDKDNAIAQTNLGIMYHHGLGTPVDRHEAQVWFEKAAIQDIALAQYNLALVHHGRFLKGRHYGVNEGLINQYAVNQFLYWYQQAANQGHAAAKSALADLKVEQIEHWANSIFDNRFFVYKFTGHEIIQGINRVGDLSETIKLHGERFIKKIWIKVKIQVNEDGSYKLDEEGNITSCEIIEKSPNLLDIGKDSDCIIKPDKYDLFLASKYRALEKRGFIVDVEQFSQRNFKSINPLHIGLSGNNENNSKLIIVPPIYERYPWLDKFIEYIWTPDSDYFFSYWLEDMGY